MSERYTFPGLRPYAEKAADDAGLDDHSIRARLGVGPIPEAITTALSQLQAHADHETALRIPAGTVDEVMARIDANLKALDVQRDALKAAVDDVYGDVRAVMDKAAARKAESERAAQPAAKDDDEPDAKPARRTKS